MVSSELISTLQGLSRADKFYVMQVLLSDLAQQETDLIQPDQSYPVRSPYDADEAADTMLKVLQAASKTVNKAERYPFIAGDPALGEARFLLTYPLSSFIGNVL